MIAELIRPSPETLVLAWADRLDPVMVGITTMNEAEILHGIWLSPSGWQPVAAGHFMIATAARQRSLY